MSRKEKQEIETLNERMDYYIRELDRANTRNRNDKEYITQLKKLLDEEKARYVALLESYIGMMERVARMETLLAKKLK